MPRQEAGDCRVERLRHLAIDFEVVGGTPADVGVGVVIRETHRAAGGEQDADQERAENPHQKLSTVIWPGARRRCFFMPRKASAACTSFSICGLPQSMTCEFAAVSATPAAASSRPSAMAAGMRPASEPGAASRLTKETYFAGVAEITSR